MLRDEAYKKFKEYLFEGKISPGDFLSQQKLSDLLDIPLGPTREALKKLESENLVRLVKQRGIHVCFVDVDLIKNACQVREFFELTALEHFVKNASDAEIKRIKDMTLAASGKLKKNSNASALKAVSDADAAMHFSFVNSLGNEIFAEMYERNFDKVRVIRLQSVFGPERAEGIMREHLAILDACEKRDIDLAKAALHKHLSVSRNRAMGLDE